MIDVTNDLGIQLRKLRKLHGQSLAITANAINTDRAYLNKIELGKIKPSQRLLDKILVHFSVEGNMTTMLKQLAGHAPLNFALVDERKDSNSMAQQSMPMAMPQQMAQVAINPAQTPVLYTDSVIVSSSEFGLVLDIAQAFGGGLQQNVVARIGMSYEHAKKLIERIHEQIEKNER